MLRQNFPAALSILQEGLRRQPDPRYIDALAYAYVAFSDFRGADPRAPADRLHLLSEALRQNGKSVPALHRLLALTRDQRPVGKPFRATLTAIFNGDRPALVHLLLGIDSERQGRPEEAWHDFDQAFRNNSEIVGLANDLGRAARRYGADRPQHRIGDDQRRHRHLAQPVAFARTRGHILAKLGRWKEAFADLEAALPALTDKETTYRTLAETCEHLGMAELAASTNTLPAMDRREDDRKCSWWKGSDLGRN